MTLQTPGDPAARYLADLEGLLITSLDGETTRTHVARSATEARATRADRHSRAIRLGLLAPLLATLVGTSGVAVAGSLPHRVQGMVADAAHLLPVPVPIPYPDPTTREFPAPTPGIDSEPIARQLGDPGLASLSEPEKNPGDDAADAPPRGETATADEQAGDETPEDRSDRGEGERDHDRSRHDGRTSDEADDGDHRDRSREHGEDEDEHSDHRREREPEHDRDVDDGRSEEQTRDRHHEDDRDERSRDDHGDGDRGRDRHEDHQHRHTDQDRGR